MGEPPHCPPTRFTELVRWTKTEKDLPSGLFWEVYLCERPVVLCLLLLVIKTFYSCTHLGSPLPRPPPISPWVWLTSEDKASWPSAVSHYTAMQPFIPGGGIFLTPAPQGTGGVGEPPELCRKDTWGEFWSIDRSSSLTRLEE